MPRAIILAGTGAIGRASALRLLQEGWSVDVTGRRLEMFSPEVRGLGGCFVAAERDDVDRLAQLVAGGAELLVDCACFGANGARQLLPFMSSIASTVVISSKSVYVDDHGRHANSEVAPHFDGPIRETQPMVRAGGGNPFSREGYGANKVAAEQVLLESGYPVSVLRPAKVHGVDARRPREWYFVKRVLDGRPAVLLAERGAGVDHTTAAANVAALISLVAAKPAARVLNCADPDAPNVREIARTIAAHFSYRWDEVLLDDDAPEDLGRTPWDAPSPVVLDMSAAQELGYFPAGVYASTVAAELDWLASVAIGPDEVRLPADLDADFFHRSFDYAAEDGYLIEYTKDRRTS